MSTRLGLPFIPYEVYLLNHFPGLITVQLGIYFEAALLVKSALVRQGPRANR
jgi:hypothetical protein